MAAAPSRHRPLKRVRNYPVTAPAPNPLSNSTALHKGPPSERRLILNVVRSRTSLGQRPISGHRRRRTGDVVRARFQLSGADVGDLRADSMELSGSIRATHYRTRRGGPIRRVEPPR